MEFEKALLNLGYVLRAEMLDEIFVAHFAIQATVPDNQQ